MKSDPEFLQKLSEEEYELYKQVGSHLVLRWVPASMTLRLYCSCGDALYVTGDVESIQGAINRFRFDHQEHRPTNPDKCLRARLKRRNK